MKKLTAISILFFLIYNGILAQSQNNMTWEMAVRKHIGFSGDTEDFSPSMPIRMENDDEFYIYLKSDSPGYAYVVKEYPDRTSSIVFSGPLTAGKPEQILDNHFDFTIPPSGSGIIRFYVVVSSTQRPILEQNLGVRLSGAQQAAVTEEIQRIRRSLTGIPPERPVSVASGTRGTAGIAGQYEGFDTYVRNVVISY